jgi:hypothetical protein
MGLKSWLGKIFGIGSAKMSTTGGYEFYRTRTEAIAHRIAQKKRRAAKKARKINRRCK